MRVGRNDRISVPVRGGRENSALDTPLSPSPLHPLVRTRRKSSQLHAEKRERVLTRDQNGLHLDLGLPNPRNCEKYISVV